MVPYSSSFLTILVFKRVTTNYMWLGEYLGLTQDKIFLKNFLMYIIIFKHLRLHLDRTFEGILNAYILKCMYFIIIFGVF